MTRRLRTSRNSREQKPQASRSQAARHGESTTSDALACLGPDADDAFFAARSRGAGTPASALNPPSDCGEPEHHAEDLDAENRAPSGDRLPPEGGPGALQSTGEHGVCAAHSPETPAVTAPTSAGSWDALDEDQQRHLVSTVTRFLLVREQSRIPVLKRDITSLVAETLGVPAGPRGRFPTWLTTLRNAALERAAQMLLFDLGFRVLQVGRLPLGEHARGRTRQAARGLTLTVAPYHFYQERCLIEGAPPSHDEAPPGNDGMPSDLLLLVSDLPPKLRPQPRSIAFSGLLMVLACLFGLSDTGMIQEKELFNSFARIGLMTVHNNSQATREAALPAHTHNGDYVPDTNPLRGVPANDADPDATGAVSGDNVWFHGYQRKADIHKLLTLYLPKMLYLQRFRLNIADSEWTYAAGPRLRAELPPESLFELLCEFFGEDADEGAATNLRRRLLPDQPVMLNASRAES